MTTMSGRLKHARQQAGFKTASAAIDHFRWHSSSYRAHENGQNNYKIKDAHKYAEAYGVAAIWLLIGEEDGQKKRQTRHKHNCIEHIHAAALLLKDDPENKALLKKIKDCTDSQLDKIS